MPRKSTRSIVRKKKMKSRRVKARKTVKARKPVTRRVRAKKTPLEKKTEAATYVYECTRPGCGYRIWRDEKGEPGQIRLDLKCPKCHNEEFRCLGKGDLPETFEVPAPAPTPPFDLDTEKLLDLGSK